MIIYNIQEIKINQKYIFDIIKKNKVLKEKCIRRLNLYTSNNIKLGKTNDERL